MYGIYHIVISSKQFSGEGGLIKYHYHDSIPSIHPIKIALHLQSVLMNIYHLYTYTVFNMYIR